jgi:hypothetical protein
VIVAYLDSWLSLCQCNPSTKSGNEDFAKKVDRTYSSSLNFPVNEGASKSGTICPHGEVRRLKENECTYRISLAAAWDGGWPLAAT